MYLKELQLISAHSVQAPLCALGCLRTTTRSWRKKLLLFVQHGELSENCPDFPSLHADSEMNCFFPTCYRSRYFYLLRLKSTRVKAYYFLTLLFVPCVHNILFVFQRISSWKAHCTKLDITALSLSFTWPFIWWIRNGVRNSSTKGWNILQVLYVADGMN